MANEKITIDHVVQLAERITGGKGFTFSLEEGWNVLVGEYLGTELRLGKCVGFTEDEIEEFRGTRQDGEPNLPIGQYRASITTYVKEEGKRYPQTTKHVGTPIEVYSQSTEEEQGIEHVYETHKKVIDEREQARMDSLTEKANSQVLSVIRD